MSEIESKSSWFVYMLQTQCGKLYTGISTDVDRRFKEHCETYEGRSQKGAKFFRGKKPDKVVYRESCLSRSEASTREFQIKKMSVIDKRALF